MITNYLFIHWKGTKSQHRQTDNILPFQPHPFPPNNWDVICTAGELELQRSVIDEYTSSQSPWDSAYPPIDSRFNQIESRISQRIEGDLNFWSGVQKQRQTVDSVDPQLLGKHAEQSWGQCAG